MLPELEVKVLMDMEMALLVRCTIEMHNTCSVSLLTMHAWPAWRFPDAQMRQPRCSRWKC